MPNGMAQSITLPCRIFGAQARNVLALGVALGNNWPTMRVTIAKASLNDSNARIAARIMTRNRNGRS